MTGSVAGLMCAHAEQLTFYFTSQRFEYIEWKAPLWAMYQFPSGW